MKQSYCCLLCKGVSKILSLRRWLLYTIRHTAKPISCREIKQKYLSKIVSFIISQQLLTYNSISELLL